MHREHQVIGPPGCGKTTYLARQVVRAADRYSPAGVAVASLTRTAAAEVAGRGTGLPRENIGTLHSHAYHALGKPKIMEVDGIKEWNDWVDTAKYMVSGAMSANPEQAPIEMMALDTEGDELLQEMGVLRQRMIGREFWPGRVKAFAAKWDEFKAATGRTDFTGLIEDAYAGAYPLPSKPIVFMLDEAQDMSLLEMRLARQWGDLCEQFVIVGDPDQNLYEWRGSDPSAFFERQAASEQVLSQSYRVPRAVCAAALGWIEQIPDRKDVVYEPRDFDGVVRHDSLCWDEPVALADAVAEQAARGRSVMVLGSCGYMLNPLVAELKDRGETFHNPYRPTQGAWNPLAGAGRLLAFLRPRKEVWGDDAHYWTYRELKYWTDVMQAKGYLTRGTKEHLKGKVRKDRFGTDYGEGHPQLTDLMALFEEAHHEAVWTQDVDWWEQSLKHDDRRRQQFALAVHRKHGGARLRERPRIIVGTIHSVKGGEADVVYLFPDLSTAGFFGGWETGQAERWAIVRQMYVGMTRAREELVLCQRSSSLAVDW